MSDWKNYEKFLRGEYYPGAPKTPWRIAMEADFAKRGIAMESAPIVFRNTRKLPPTTGRVAQ